jgi:hypothetical protein
LAVVAVVVLIGLWGSRDSSSGGSAWNEFYEIGNADAKSRPKRLKELAEKYPDTQIALWARLDYADQLCYDGHAKLAIDRTIATTYLRDAQQNYQLILKNPKALPEMKRRAALAEAKCWELLGDRDKAIDSYRAAAKQFATDYPELAKDAASRASELEQPEAADFYKWLASYEPPAISPPKLPSMAPLFPPDNDDARKSRGTDESAMDGKEPAKPDAGNAEDKKSSEDKPKAESESAAPATDKEAETKPAAKEKTTDPNAESAPPTPDADK